MLQIPLEAQINQQFMVVLDDQDCTITLYQRGHRMYLDLKVDGDEVCNGAIVLGGVGIVRVAQNKFTGQLYMIDTKEETYTQEVPNWEELGDRFLLYYLTEDEEDSLADSLEDIAKELDASNEECD